jgi:hypothetical protein
MCIRLGTTVVGVLLLLVSVFNPTLVAASSLETESGSNPLCAGLPGQRVKEVDFYLYFASEALAIDAAARIDDATFNVEVRTSAAGPEWLLRAVFRELPTEGSRVRHSETMGALAKASGGRYEGSGCASYFSFLR